MEALTALIWVAGLATGVYLVRDMIKEEIRMARDAKTLAAKEAAETFQAAYNEMKAELFPSWTKLLDSMSTKLDPTIVLNSKQPMPANLQTWIHTWPDQWAIDQQMQRAETLYKELGDWAGVQVQMVREAQTSEVSESDAGFDYQ